MDFGQATPEDVWRRGYERLLSQWRTHAVMRDAATKERERAKAEWLRAEEQFRATELRMEVADEMVKAYLDTNKPPENVLPLKGLGRFSGMKLKNALTTIFAEEPTHWFAVPELEEKLNADGFDGDIANLNAAIHAACKRFKSGLETQDGPAGKKYRHVDPPTNFHLTGQELEAVEFPARGTAEIVSTENG